MTTAPGPAGGRAGGPEGALEVLALLEQDARITPEKIAQATGRRVEEVREIIARAEGDGTIVRYGALVNWTQAGRNDVWAWIELKVAPEQQVGFDAVATRIAKFPQTWSVYLTSGTYDIGVLVRGADMQEISDFVAHKLATLGAVQSTVTHFIMRRYKAYGVEFARPPEGDRQPVTL